MCPLYLWRHDACGKETQVVRRVDDIEIPPEKCEHCEDPAPEYKRLTCAPKMVRGAGWGGQKGSWALLLVVAASLLLLGGCARTLEEVPASQVSASQISFWINCIGGYLIAAAILGSSSCKCGK